MQNRLNDVLASGIFSVFLLTILGWAVLGLLSVVAAIKEFLL